MSKNERWMKLKTIMTEAKEGIVYSQYEYPSTSEENTEAHASGMIFYSEANPLFLQLKDFSIVDCRG